MKDAVTMLVTVPAAPGKSPSRQRAAVRSAVTRHPEFVGHPVMVRPLPAEAGRRNWYNDCQAVAARILEPEVPPEVRRVLRKLRAALDARKVKDNS